MDGGLHVAVLAGAEQLGNKDGTADVASEGERDKDQRNLVAVADCRQRFVVDELPGDKAVGNIVQLLKDDTAEQRQAEFPQYRAGFSGGQILIHDGYIPLFSLNRYSIPQAGAYVKYIYHIRNILL